MLPLALARFTKACAFLAAEPGCEQIAEPILSARGMLAHSDRSVYQ